MAVPGSGHTIINQAIEFPEKEFIVSFWQPTYTNVLRFDEGRRWVRVKAMTPEGALKITKYHYYSSDALEILPCPPENE